MSLDLTATRLPRTLAPQSIPFASRVRCLGALGAGWRSTALGPGLLAAGPASTDPTPLNRRAEGDQITNRITTMTTAMTRATIAMVRVSMARPYSVSRAVHQTLQVAPRFPGLPLRRPVPTERGTVVASSGRDASRCTSRGAGPRTLTFLAWMPGVPRAGAPRDPTLRRCTSWQSPPPGSTLAALWPRQEHRRARLRPAGARNDA